jgi:hypothetical protein
MAKKPQPSPFELSEIMNEFRRMYDPEKMQEIFNPQKFMEQVKAMTPGSVDLGNVVDQNRRNFEAMVEANKAMAETYRDMLEKQAEIFTRMTNTAAQYVSGLEAAGNPEAAKRNAEAYGRSVETALKLMQEMADAVRAANEKVFKDAQEQVTAALEELKSS